MDVFLCVSAVVLVCLVGSISVELRERLGEHGRRIEALEEAEHRRQGRRELRRSLRKGVRT